MLEVSFDFQFLLFFFILFLLVLSSVRTEYTSASLCHGCIRSLSYFLVVCPLIRVSFGIGEEMVNKVFEMKISN